MNRIALCAAPLAALLALALAPSALAQTGPGSGLAGSPHDFTAVTDATGASALTEPIGLCTFCHTPHRAPQTRLLWNHTLSANTFDWSDAETTVNGTVLQGFDSAWQGISKNCLSCHDGTVAIGDVAWFNAAPKTGLDAILDHQHDAADDPALITYFNPGSGDLRGNHPVAHPYPFQGQASTYNGQPSGSEVLGSGWQQDPQTLGIRLFNDNAGFVSAGAVVGSTGIECSSCHEPHNSNLAVDEYFLRGTLTGSDTGYICLKCHVK